MAYGHVPVLLEACLRVLDPKPGEVYVDCTAGLGGHAAAVAEKLGEGEVVLNDADPLNMAVASERVRSLGVRVRVLTGNFAEVPNRLAAAGVRADMVLADLGFASTQVDDPSRGFSFSRDGPLDMRMDPSLPVSAADLVNGLPEAELAELIRRYGEERAARRIASKLVRARAERPILTTARLADLVRSAAGGRGDGGIDPATRTFQALRIAVNDEIGSLEALLEAAVRDAERISNNQPTEWLKPGARFAVISFHSLEDRPVKRAMERLERLGAEDLTGGAVTAGDEEVSANPRARSAKLRAARLPRG
jgi:16S rRNA (cytosine1402-N4)-methyltransferase